MPLWTPADLISPTKLWLDDQSSVTDVSGAASQWNDQSGNGNHFSQATAGARPTINATGLNSLRTLTFDGTNDCLSSAVGNAQAIMQNTPQGWILAIYRTAGANTVGEAQRLIGFSTNVSGGLARLVLFNANSSGTTLSLSLRRLDADANTALTSSTSPPFASWCMALGVRDYAGGAAEIWRDGTRTGSISSLSAGNTSNTSSFGVFIGAADDLTQFYRGDIAAILVGSGAKPSAAEVDKLFGWAAWRYGLQGSLPVDHPYKSAAPNNAVIAGAQTLAGVSQTATGTVSTPAPDRSFAGSQTLADVAQVATATAPASLAGAQALATVTQSAAVAALAKCAAGQTLAGVTQVATGSVPDVTGSFSAAQTLDAVVQAAAAVATAKAAAAQTLSGVGQSAASSSSASAAAAQTLDAAVGAATAIAVASAQAAQTLAAVSQAATATVGDTVRAFVAAQVLAGVVQVARVRPTYVFERNERTVRVVAEDRSVLLIPESRRVAILGERRAAAFTD